jgi:hypothetical protein
VTQGKELTNVKTGESSFGQAGSGAAGRGDAVQGKGLKPTVERNPSVDLLVAEAAKHKDEDGWVFSYAEMTRIAGGHNVVDIRECNGVIQSWLKFMLRDHEMVFAAIPNVGYRLCDDNGKVDVMLHHLRKARKQCKRAEGVEGVVDPAKVAQHRLGDFARAKAARHLAARELSLSVKASDEKRIARLPKGRQEEIRKLLGLAGQGQACQGLAGHGGANQGKDSTQQVIPDRTDSSVRGGDVA